jgi:hypothetical protein
VKTTKRGGRGALVAGGFGAVALAALGWMTAAAPGARAGFFLTDWLHGWCGHAGCAGPPPGDVGGTWYWQRSPDEEQRVVNALYNRYCVRCHAVDSRGVWDMPDIPDFTDPRWQACRSDDMLAHIILEGRGAVMPAFRGTLTFEEAWAMARHLRTFAEGAAVRPDLGKGGDRRESGATPPPGPTQLPMPKPGP